MADLDIFRDEFLPSARTAKTHNARWRQQNPGEAQRWDTYEAAVLRGESPTPPDLATDYGQMLVAAAAMAVEPVPEPDPVTLTQTIQQGTILGGDFIWAATPSVAVDKVEFYVDGQLKWTEALAPYVCNGDGQVFDVDALGDGPHVFRVRALKGTAVVAETQAQATVAVEPAPDPTPDPTPGPVGEGFRSPWLFDRQDLTAYGGWTGKFLNGGNRVDRLKGVAPFPPDQVANRHTVVDSGEPRDRCYLNFNSFGTGMDNGSDARAGVTNWWYFEFYVPAGFPLANGSWNTVGLNLHHTHGVNGSIGQIPFRFVLSNQLGFSGYGLLAQVRGGRQRSTDLNASDAPNNEDFILSEMGPVRFDHVYRCMVRHTLAPNGTPPRKNEILNQRIVGDYIVPLSEGNSHGVVEIWVDDERVVGKRRPTSYYGLTMYPRSGMDRNGSSPTHTGILRGARMTVARTRPELFQTIRPAVADTFAPGG